MWRYLKKTLSKCVVNFDLQSILDTLGQIKLILIRGMAKFYINVNTIKGCIPSILDKMFQGVEVEGFHHIYFTATLILHVFCTV